MTKKKNLEVPQSSLQPRPCACQVMSEAKAKPTKKDKKDTEFGFTAEPWPLEKSAEKSSKRGAAEGIGVQQSAAGVDDGIDQRDGQHLHVHAATAGILFLLLGSRLELYSLWVSNLQPLNGTPKALLAISGLLVAKLDLFSLYKEVYTYLWRT